MKDKTSKQNWWAKNLAFLFSIKSERGPLTIIMESPALTDEQAKAQHAAWERFDKATGRQV